MRRKVFAIMMMITALTGTSITAAAAGNATVTFTEKNELVYSNVSEDGSNVNLGSAFEGVAPGETRTQVITLVNSNARTVDFYMSTEVLQALEDSKEQAAGAGYDIVLTAADRELYNSTLGGYTEEASAGSKAGLKGMNSGMLEKDVLVATLKQGETATVTLQITFDGEAMDNSTSIDYSDALGKVSFGFKAGYEEATGVTKQERIVTEKGETKYVTQMVEEKVPLAAKTGDKAMILGGIAMLAVGVGLFVLTGKKRVEEQP